MTTHNYSYVIAFFFTAALAAHADTGDLDSAQLELPIPEVLTPVRLKQPRTEVPASVTVIDRALITASGIREIPELFRLVPGLIVGARSGWDYAVSYHGTNRRNSRRMQVLIDGRSVYQAGFATIDWVDIPLAIEDIERIEVTRGPDTAAYGANAFLGIINIITRHPDDSPRLQLKATGGNNSTEDYYVSTSGNMGESSYRVSAATRRDSGFDKNEDGEVRNDSKNSHMVNGRWMFSPLNHWSMDLQAGYKTNTKTEDWSDESMYSAPDHRIDDYFLSINSQHFLANHHSIEWQLDHTENIAETEWIACVPAAALNIPSSIPVCGETDENSKNTRTDFDLQYTLFGQSSWKLVTGAHAQQQRVKSQTYYGGTVGRSTYQLFANFEYRFLPKMSATLGGSQEYEDNGGRDFSPRVALLYFPTENQSIRAVYSEAIRTPDLFENEVDWSYTVRHLRPVINGQNTGKFIFTAKSPGNLREEHIKSRELGYYSLWFNRRLAVDMKIYNDSLENLISQNLSLFNFKPNNESEVHQEGFETEIDYRHNEQLRLRLTYALIHSETDILPEEDLTAHKSGSAAILYSMPGDWQFSTIYYYAYPINTNKFTRLDARIAKRLPIASGNITVSGVVQHYFYKYADLFRDNLYDQPNRVYISIDMTF